MRKCIIILSYGLSILLASPDSLEVEIDEPVMIKDEIKFFGDHTIAAGTVNKDNIRILGGDLSVYGTVGGKITIVGGNVTLGSTAIVNGTIVAIGGRIQKEEGAVVNGKIIETHLKEGLVYREMESAERVDGDSELTMEERSLKTTESWIHPKESTFIYNRNEGLVFHLNHTWDGGKKSTFRLCSSLGYRFGTDQGVGRLSLEKNFFTNNNLIVFLSIFKDSRTDDSYRLPENENSWAAILARQDFYDRWDEEGWSTGIGLDLHHIKFKFLTAAVRQGSIPVINNLWSLFHKERDLRPNPIAITHEQIDYIQTTAAYRSKIFSPITTGLKVFFQGEAYQNSDSGSSIYSMQSTELRKRIMGYVKLNWEFSYGIVLRTQFMGGTSNGQLDYFRKFGMGGLGSVSAFPYKYQTGDQMLQMNGELLFTENFTDDWFFIKLFADAGHAWDGSTYSLDFTEFKKQGLSAAGIGFGSIEHEELKWSINFAKPLNGKDYLETTIRINYNF